LIDHGRAVLWLHIFGAAAVAVSCILLFALSTRAFRSYWPGALATLLWGVLFTRDAMTGASLLEVFQAPLVLAALLIFVVWASARTSGHPTRIRQMLPLVMAGVVISAAALVKPPAVLVVPVLAAAAFLTPRTKSSAQTRLAAALAVVAGATAAIGLEVLPYLFWPTALHALLFNMLDLTSRYASNQGSLLGRANALMGTFDLADVALVVIAVLGHTIVFSFNGARWTAAQRVENLIRAVLLVSGLALCAGYAAGETKGNYSVAILPPLALYGWSVLLLGYQWTTERVSRVAYTAVCLGVILVVLPSTLPTRLVTLYSQAQATHGTYAPPLLGVNASTLAAAIDARSRPGDTIWVYYNAPELYWLADRKPATDEPIGTWLVDNYDQFWFERTLAQLRQERPSLIVGIATPRYPRQRAATVQDLPLIGAYIQTAYVCSTASPTDVGGAGVVVFCSLRPS
jgi:hypothetical protein